MITDIQALIEASRVLTMYIEKGIAQDPDQSESCAGFAKSVEKLIVNADGALIKLREYLDNQDRSHVVAKQVSSAVKTSAKSKTFRPTSKGVDEVKTGENNHIHFSKKGSLHVSVPMMEFKCVDVKHGTNEAKQNKAWCKTTLQSVTKGRTLDHSFRVVVWDEVQIIKDGLTSPLKQGEFITLPCQWKVTKIVPKGGRFNKDFDEITIQKVK